MLKQSNAKEILSALSYVFDDVRIVDPLNNSVISIIDSFSLSIKPHECYKVWDKHKSCSNCISYQSTILNKRISKYEFVNNDIFYIVTKPISLLTHDGNNIKCCIEVVSNVTNEISFGTYGIDKTIDKIIASENRVYIDSLTKIYNRKYFDERVFCNYIDFENHITFIVIDLKNFKSINDNFGHIKGDMVLSKTAKIINDNLEPCDFAIRLGGDEFLIILNRQLIIDPHFIVNSIKNQMKSCLIYDEETNSYAEANFGISSTDNFINDPKFISNLLSIADNNMYIDKLKQ